MVDLALHQRPDHVAHVGENVVIDGDPYIVIAIKPKREDGVFLDWNSTIEYNEVIVSVERFDGHPS